MRKLTLFISLVTYCFILFSQEIEKYNLFTTSPLIDNYISAIREFEDGVYVGQDIGLTRFNGHEHTHIFENTEFRYLGAQDIYVVDTSEMWFVGAYRIGHYMAGVWEWFTELDNIEIESFCRIDIDKSGRVWVTTYNGLFMYENEIWTHFTESDGVLGGQATTVKAHGNDVYVAFGSYEENYGVSKFDGQNWTNITPDNGLIGTSVREICIDQDSAIWFCTDEGVAKFDGSNWQYYTTADGLGSNIVNGMEIDNYNNMWFGTYSYNTNSGGITKFDGESWTTYTVEDGLPTHKIFQLECTSDNKLWIGTPGNGICIMDLNPLEIRVEKCIVRGGVNDVNLYKPYIDKNNVFWVQGGQHLTRLLNNEWESFDKYELSSDIPSIQFEDLAGNMVYGGGRHFSVYNGQSWSNYSGVNALIGYDFNDYVKDSNSIWFATTHGVYNYNGNIWTNYTVADNLLSNEILHIDCDNNNNIWCATYSEGICKFQNNEWITYPYPETTIPYYLIGFDTDLSGNIWYTSNRSVFQFDGENWTKHDTASGFDAPSRSGLAIDTSNNVWVGSRNLHKWDGNQWTTLYIEDSITEGSIDYIVVDKTNNLWLTFNACIYKVIQSNSYNVEDYSSSDYTPILYPNPAVDDVTINFTGKKATISIYDLSGREIKSFEAYDSFSEISLSDFSNGTYIIKIDNGTDCKSIKLIISH
ncbi:MAG: two-component regulator propeller domain-containing protein [Bacteroidales bacterium]|nr:two-component regulator propeller domain-containing protein [Bacteroidales bacterium]